MVLTVLSAVELSRLIRSGEVSAREVLDAHLDRIDQRNGSINAVVSIDEEGAREAAAAADEAQARGLPLGQLHGLPISFKDTARTAGMRTTYGSPQYARNIPDSNDLHVDRILEAGAIRVGKTNVPEHAAGSNTFNPVFGATRNPYDQRMSVGGSSGGAAAALAAGFQPIADGSDMGGSLRNPAAFCNVVGLRPTPGTVPNANGSNIFSPLTVTGPMGRTVDDVALLYSVMGGPHPSDPGSYAANPSRPPLREEDLSGLRVALAPTLGGRIAVDPEIRETVERQAQVLELLGASVELACPDLDEADQVFRTLRSAEFFAEFGGQLDADPNAFNEFLTGNIESGRGLDARAVIKAQEGLTRLVRGAAGFFQEYDLILAPTTQLPPFPVEQAYPTELNGQPLSDYLDWMKACYLLTPLGIPAISVPAGFTSNGLPIGIQMASARGSDAFLLGVARRFEQAAAIPTRLLPIETEAR
jgi:amidase